MVLKYKDLSDSVLTPRYIIQVTDPIMFIKIIILIELTLSHVFLKFIEINDIGIRDNSKNIKNMTMLSDRMHNVIIITLIFIM